MATFSVIDAVKAPRPLRQNGRLAARMAEYENFVKGVKKGQVGKLSPSSGETPRSVAVRVTRAGTRIGRSVDAWVVDGLVYFRVPLRK